MLRWSAVQAKNVDGGVAVVPTAQPLPEQSTPSEAIPSQDLKPIAPREEEEGVQAATNTNKARGRSGKKKKKKAAHEATPFTSLADLDRIMAVTLLAGRSENVIEMAPQTHPEPSIAGLSPESSASPSAFASQGVEEEPTETLTPSSRERMASLIDELERLANTDDDATTLRTGIRALVEPFQNLMQMYDHETLASEATIMVLKKKEQEAAARSLVVTAFDNTLDRVSEGQVKSDLVSLNHAIADFTLDIMQSVFEVTPDQAVVDKARQSGRNSLVTRSSYLRLDDEENRGYLIEALVHKTVVERLHYLFFQGQVAITNRSKATEKMFEAIVMKEESWKVAQRWRSITSNVFDRQLEPAVISRDITRAAELISADISSASGRPLDALPELKADILRTLPKVYEEAKRVASSARRDHISSQLKIVMSPSKQDMPIIDTNLVDIQWEGIVAPAGDDRVLGTYAFGLLKVQEDGPPIVLLRPKIITGSLERLDPAHTRDEAKKAEAKEAKAARRAAKGGNKEGLVETGATEPMKRDEEPEKPEGEMLEGDIVTQRSDLADEFKDEEGQSSPVKKKKKKKGSKKKKAPQASQMNEDRGLLPYLGLDDCNTDRAVNPPDEPLLNDLV